MTRATTLRGWISCLSLVAACSDGGNGGDPPVDDPTGPIVTVSSVTLNSSSLTVARGQVARIEATALDGTGKAVSGMTMTWTTGDPAIATVDGAGNVTGVGAGTTTVTATAQGKSANASFTTIRFASVQPGSLTTCALTPTGQLFCANEASGGMARPVASPVPLKTLTSHGEPQASPVTHHCAIGTDDSAYCWGANARGQLGTGDTRTQASPTLVAGGLKFKSISAGHRHTCALTLAGDAYCWGEGAFGQLGSANIESSPQPLLVAGAPRFAQIESGPLHVCGLTDQGDAWCWGRNLFGQLGRGSANAFETAAAPVSGGLKFQSIAVKWHWTCGVTSDGKSYCWGDNTLGQLGSVTATLCDVDKPCATVPAAVAATQAFTVLAASQFSTCGIETSGQVWCWGGDMQNQFGASQPPAGCPVDGFAFGCTPNAIRGPSGFAVLAGSPRNYCGMGSNGIAYCWGGNDVRQIGPVTGNKPTPIVFSIDPRLGQ